MSRTRANVLAALACLVAAGCSTTTEPQSGTDTRTKQGRTQPIEPDGMKGGGSSM